MGKGSKMWEGAGKVGLTCGRTCPPVGPRPRKRTLREDAASIMADLIPRRAGQGIEGVGWDGEIAEALHEASSLAG